MLEYFTNAIDGKPRRIDLHSLRIGKVAAYDMKVEDIFVELTMMGCPRINNQMSKTDLLLRYGVWLLERDEAAA